MRRTLGIAISLIFSACSFSAFAAESLSVDQVAAMLETGEQPVRIVCLGDSLTGAYYHSGGRRAWPEMLAIALKRIHPRAQVEVFNAGISGEPSARGLARIDRDVIDRKPQLVVVMFGANDIPGGNPENFRENLRAIVKRCRAAGAAVVLSTITAFSPNERRPESAVVEYSQIIRDVAREFSAPVADHLPVFQAIRDGDPTDWAILMSDELHPTMLGHKKIAETVAKTITGQSVSLADVPPPTDSLGITLARLKAGEPIRVVAMPPYDSAIRETLVELFPNAKIDLVVWPVEGQSMAEILDWAKRIRDLKPNLVIPAIPSNVKAADDESFIRDYQLILSSSIAYEGKSWDLLPILPRAKGKSDAVDQRRAELVRRVIPGYDVLFIDATGDSAQPPHQLLQKWIQQHCISK